MVKKTARVVIDTNILVSFLINKDFSRLDKIIIEGRAILIISAELLEELLEVLDRPKFKKIISTKEKEILIDFFGQHGKLISVKSKVNICRDKKDNFLLNLAIDGKATHLITGDKDLLELKKIKGTIILKISDFLNIE